MRPYLVRVCAFLFLIGCGLARPAAAQDRSVLLGAGASFLHFESGTGAGFMVNLAADIAGPPAAALGVIGDYAWHREEGINSNSFSGGARYTFRPQNGRVIPFAQFIIGGIRFSAEGESSWATLYAPGGGVMIPLTDRLTALAQIDIAIVRFEGGDGETGERYTFGVAYRVR